jgi:hypothetical protein
MIYEVFVNLKYKLTAATFGEAITLAEELADKNPYKVHLYLKDANGVIQGCYNIYPSNNLDIKIEIICSSENSGEETIELDINNPAIDSIYVYNELSLYRLNGKSAYARISISNITFGNIVGDYLYMHEQINQYLIQPLRAFRRMNKIVSV